MVPGTGSYISVKSMTCESAVQICSRREKVRAVFDRTRTGAPELFYGRQRVVVAFALLAGDSAGVKSFRQLSRALINAAEHVGKQIEGVAGCRASGGSGGMAGTLDEHGDLLAQAVSSRSSGSGISARLVTFLSSIVSYLLLCRGAALFFGARSIYRLRLGLSGGRLHVGDLARADQVLTVDTSGDAEQQRKHVRQYQLQKGHFRSFACSCFSSSGE